MTNDQSQIEIMAPVGCWESLAAAIQAGATSVYFGIEHLNMRARSSVNFTTDDLATIAATCRGQILSLFDNYCVSEFFFKFVFRKLPLQWYWHPKFLHRYIMR